MQNDTNVTGIGSTGLKSGGSAHNDHLLMTKTTKAILSFGSIAGLVVSVMSALNICNSACSEAGLYTFLGINMGYFGVIFFGSFCGAFALLHHLPWSEKIFTLLVYAAIGAELRMVWLQKYVIGSWCPLCLTITAIIFLMAIALLLNQWHKMQLRRSTMKLYMKYLLVVLFSAILGLSCAVLGVKKDAEAAELDMFLGKMNSSTSIYFVSDWFCPACRRTEPAIASMYTKIAGIAKVSFVDIPVHPETSNFTPYNTQFLVYEKGKYIQLRGALSDLARRMKTPSSEDVQKAIAPFGVKLRTMNYADIASGMTWNENIFRTYEIKATPTVVVTNQKTGKHVNLVGENEISYRSILNAINEVGK